MFKKHKFISFLIIFVLLFSVNINNFCIYNNGTKFFSKLYF